MKLLLPLMTLLLASAAIAQDASPEAVLFIDGECKTLLVGEEDMQSVCAPQVVQVSYTGGRMELMVSTGDQEGSFMVFIGQKVQSGSPETVLHEIEQVAFSLDPMGDDITTTNATGACHYGDAFAGPAQITCAIKDETGKVYNFDFLSDGTAPDDVLG